MATPSLFVSMLPAPAAWLWLSGGFVLALLLAFPRTYLTPRLLMSVMHLLVIFWLMMRLLFDLRDANRTFIHMPHES